MNELWHHYIEILSDPAHTLVEFTFVLIDVLIIQWVISRVRRWIRREHRLIDLEHGHEHDDEISEVAKGVSDNDIVNALIHKKYDPQVIALVKTLYKDIPSSDSKGKPPPDTSWLELTEIKEGRIKGGSKKVASAKTPLRPNTPPPPPPSISVKPGPKMTGTGWPV